MRIKATTAKRAPAGNDRLFAAVCRSVLGQEVVPEYTFFPGRKWRFDYAIPEHMIAIEVEGATYKKTTYRDKKTGEKVTVMGGRHNIGEGYLKDMEKYNTAAMAGWRVFRVTPADLMKSKTLDMLKSAIEKK